MYISIQYDIMWDAIFEHVLFLVYDDIDVDADIDLDDDIDEDDD